MTERSRLGDCCQNHDPMTAPVVYPHKVTIDRDSLRGDYRCNQCGVEWPCWWDMRSAGWTLDDIARYREHVVVCELDAAYTRNVTERFDGMAHPPGHDGVGTLVDVWAEPVFREVLFTIPDAGVRLSITADQAERLGRILIAEAARGRQAAA